MAHSWLEDLSVQQRVVPYTLKGISKVSYPKVPESSFFLNFPLQLVHGLTPTWPIIPSQPSGPSFPMTPRLLTSGRSHSSLDASPSFPPLLRSRPCWSRLCARRTTPACLHFSRLPLLFFSSTTRVGNKGKSPRTRLAPR